MEIKITNDAERELKQIISKSDYNDPTFKIVIAGVGWGGPKLGLTLDELRDYDENLLNINDINISIDENVARFVTGEIPIVIDYKTTPQGKGFMIDSGLHC